MLLHSNFQSFSYCPLLFLELNGISLLHDIMLQLAMIQVKAIKNVCLFFEL